MNDELNLTFFQGVFSTSNGTKMLVAENVQTLDWILVQIKSQLRNLGFVSVPDFTICALNNTLITSHVKTSRNNFQQMCSYTKVRDIASCRNVDLEISNS